MQVAIGGGEIIAGNNYFVWHGLLPILDFSATS